MPNERSLGEAGLTEALGRLRHRLDDPALGDPMISLGESLEWSYALEEYHVKRLGRHVFESQRHPSLDGRTQAGLTWVRGLFTHSLVASASLVQWMPYVTRASGGASTVLGPVAAFCWKDRSALPQGKPERHGRDVLYDVHVAGQTLLSPLEAAQRFLAALP